MAQLDDDVKVNEINTLTANVPIKSLESEKIGFGAQSPDATNCDLHSKGALSKENYSVMSWIEKYPDCMVRLERLKIHESYAEWYNSEEFDDNAQVIDCVLKAALKDNENILIFPYPDLVFNALNLTPLDEIKVVILGQDPYPSYELSKNPLRDSLRDPLGKSWDRKRKSEKIPSIIPQAMGLSFSVPLGFSIPSSLSNIYANLLKFKHIEKMPNYGDLTSWANQGCLLLNSTLTVECGKKNEHEYLYEDLTDDLIKFISNKTKNIVFVLWGAFAAKKQKLIDEKRHKILISSHPSGLSCHKPMKNYPSFAEFDHFGEINLYLRAHCKTPIIWELDAPDVLIA